MVGHTTTGMLLMTKRRLLFTTTAALALGALSLTTTGCATAEPEEGDVDPAVTKETQPEAAQSEPTTTKPAESGPAESGPAESGPAESAPASTEAPRPVYLAPQELPPSSARWKAAAPVEGLPKSGVYCAPGVLPTQGTKYREHFTDVDTKAVQVITVTDSPAKAAELVTALRQAVSNCAERTRQQHPTSKASGRDHGKVVAADGAYVHSVDSGPREEAGGRNIHLISMGRDGRIVTYIRWGQMGTLSDAPLGEFKDTTRTAVNKLRP